MKKRSDEMQTLLGGCSKAKPKIFTMPQTPSPGPRTANINTTINININIRRRSLPLPTEPVWWRSMNAILSYHGNTHTHKQTHPHTDRTDYNTLNCSVASAQCNNPSIHVFVSKIST